MIKNVIESSTPTRVIMAGIVVLIVGVVGLLTYQGPMGSALFMGAVLILPAKIAQSILICRIVVDEKNRLLKFRKSFSEVVLEKRCVQSWRLVKVPMRRGGGSMPFFEARLVTGKTFIYPLNWHELSLEETEKTFELILGERSKGLYYYRSGWAGFGLPLRYQLWPFWI